MQVFPALRGRFVLILRSSEQFQAPQDVPSSPSAAKTPLLAQLPLSESDDDDSVGSAASGERQRLDFSVPSANCLRNFAKSEVMSVSHTDCFNPLGWDVSDNGLGWRIELDGLLLSMFMSEEHPGERLKPLPGGLVLRDGLVGRDSDPGVREDQPELLDGTSDDLLVGNCSDDHGDVPKGLKPR